MCINCCNEVTKNVVLCRLTQQLMLEKVKLGLLCFKVVQNYKYLSDKQSSMQVFFSPLLNLGLEAFNFADVL